MTGTTNIDKAETTNGAEVILNGPIDGEVDGNTLQATEVQSKVAERETGKGKPESELRAAARRRGGAASP